MTRLVVNLGCVQKNALQTKAMLKDNCKFCAVVKADAYGFGAIRIAYSLRNIVDYFAVARVKEGVSLRKSGIKNNILILGEIDEREIYRAIMYGLEIQVSSLFLLRTINKVAENNELIAKIHLKFNTGMNRFGFAIEDANIIKTEVQKLKHLCIVGVFSHFMCAGNKRISDLQNKKFERLKSVFENCIFHISNSRGAFSENYQHDMVRIGIDLFFGKHPVFAFETNIVHINYLKTGEVAGYDCVFQANHDCILGIVPVGYADGIPRSFAGKVDVLVNGEFCRIVSVCMDSCLLDITSINNAKTGTKVTIFGRQKKNYSNPVEIAQICDTICYELVTNIKERVTRKYIF